MRTLWPTNASKSIRPSWTANRSSVARGFRSSWFCASWALVCHPRRCWRIIRDYRIKTIVALAHPNYHPLAVREKALAKEMGVCWLHIPIVEESTTPGERKTVADSLERAADALADPQNQPVFFHCHHGVNRASMVQMAYRMLHCGWSLEQAQAEIANSPMGLVEVRHGVDYRYMTTFYNSRVLPRRHARQQAVASAPLKSVR